MTTIVDTYTSNSTFLCPPGVTSVQVECWGGGGAGGGASSNNNGGGGAAGGQYVKSLAVPVVAGTTYTITVAQAKTGSTASAGAGNDSWFGSISTVIAKGGPGGTANNGAGGTGSTTGGIGDTVFAGGSGVAGSASLSGGGGGGAGSGGAGGAASGSTAGTGTATDGGAGGTGLAAGSNAVGGNGVAAGGGGAGAFRTATTSRAGGNGARGQIIVTYTAPLVEAIKETWDTNSRVTTVWSAYSTSGSATVVNQNKRLEITTTTTLGSSGTSSTIYGKYDLTGSSLYCMISDPGATLATKELYMCYLLNAAETDRLFWLMNVAGGLNKLRPYQKVAGATTALSTSFTYDPNLHRYLRIRESAGTTFWDYSGNGVDWTNYHSVANPITVTALLVRVFADVTGTEASSTMMAVDNMNVVPPLVYKPVSALQAINRASTY